MDVKTTLILLFSSVAALSGEAHAKCSIRVADPLITARYQECKPREFLSYLYNDLVTPFSFTCAKKLSATCQAENCASPLTADDQHRCLGRYVEILNECNRQIDDAAKMARCKDTKAWPVDSLTARAPMVNPDRGVTGVPHPATSPDRAPVAPIRPLIFPDFIENPVHVEELSPEATQSNGRPRAASKKEAFYRGVTPHDFTL